MNKNILVVMTVTGWTAFIGTVLYGLFLYGPLKFEEGVKSGQLFTQQILTTGAPVRNPEDAFETAAGEIITVSEDSLTLQPFQELNELQPLTLRIDNESAFFERFFEETSNPSLPVIFREDLINASTLKPGQSVEVIYLEDGLLTKLTLVQ